MCRMRIKRKGIDGVGLSEMGLVEWLNGYVEVSERKGGAEMGVKSNDREWGYGMR